MADIRKRVGSKGTTYQVRYPSKTTKSGYAYATFATLKEARAFREDSKARESAAPRSTEIRTVAQAIDKWLAICEKEGTDGNDPVTGYTLNDYESRAVKMKAYAWTKELHQLGPPDIVEFRSWLLNAYPRDRAAKVLGSFHSVMREMALRGLVANNAAAGISISRVSRYHQPVTIPTADEVNALLDAADRLANSQNKQTARVWRRYRPILYLAVDTGMRPQEYLALPRVNLSEKQVKVDRAIEAGNGKISVTKTPAGWRWIDWSPETRDLVMHYARHHAVENDYDLVFPTGNGQWQDIDKWRKRGFYTACEEAGLMVKSDEAGKTVEKPKYSPYDLRHFYASLLIERRTNLKRIQRLMGHKNIETTLNVYGHLIEKSEAESEPSSGALLALRKNPCGESVAQSC